jgi:hypothetical protein
MRTFGKFTETPVNEPPAGFYVPIIFPELALTGVRTRDGRLIDTATFEPLDLPRSIKLKTIDAPGHDGSVVCGRLDEVTVADNGVVSGRGWALADEVGKRAAFLLSTKALRGNSIDMSVAMKDVKIRGVEEGDSYWMEMDFTNAKLKATTLLTEPAFDNAGGEIPEGWIVEGFNEADAMVASLCAAATPSEPEAEHAFAFNILSERPKIDGALFQKPELSELTAVSPDEDERVTGHIAGWRTEHLSHPGVYPPRTNTNYAFFTSGKTVLTTEGRVAVGNLVIGGDHAPESLGWEAARDAYANTTTVWADVAIGEDDFGIWVSGIVRPGTSDEMLHAARASGCSGDWRRIGSNLELILGLSVPADGFPKPRARTFGHEADFPLTVLGAGMVVPTPKLAVPTTFTVPPSIEYLARKFATEDARGIVAEMDEFDQTFG